MGGGDALGGRGQLGALGVERREGGKYGAPQLGVPQPPSFPHTPSPTTLPRTGPEVGTPTTGNHPALHNPLVLGGRVGCTEPRHL